MKELQKKIFIVGLLAIVFAGTLVRFVVLDTYTMDRDELARVVPEFSFHSFVPPGFLYLIKTSAEIFNYSDLAYRFPVFLFGILGILLIYYLAKTFFGTREGLLSALIFTGLLTTVGYSNQAKEYMPLMVFTMLSTIFIFKIIFQTGKKKLIYLCYFVSSVLALLFSSYFYFLVIAYQIAIVILIKFFTNFKQILKLFNRILSSRKKLFLTLIALSFFTLLFIFIFRIINDYFGIYLVKPTFTAIADYFQQIAYFVTQDLKYARFLNFFLFFGFITFPFVSRYRKGYFYIILFLLIDTLFVVSLRFLHTGYPFGYPRYHSFLLPLYIIAATASVSGVIILAQKIITWFTPRFKIAGRISSVTVSQTLISVIILVVFAGYNLKYEMPIIKWYYTVPTSILLTNYKDAGEYLNFFMRPGDTLVRVKTPGMAQKFNHVNQYINRTLFPKINYSIFPERTSRTNWYVPIGTGEEDLKDFPGYLKIERIRPTLRFDAPYIAKLEYYGPLISVRQVPRQASWKASSSINGELANLAIDENMETAWNSATNTGDFFLLDLGEEHYLNSVNYNFGSQLYPQNLVLWTSRDGIDWQPGFTLATPGFIHAHDFSRIFIKPRFARFVKLDFLVDPLTTFSDISIKEIEVFEAYEKNIGIDNEKIFDADPAKHFSFSNDLESWGSGGGIASLDAKNGKLIGKVTQNATASGLKASFRGQLLKDSTVNFINFSLKVNKGTYASLLLKAFDQIFIIDKISINPDSFFHHYSLSLDNYNVPADLRTNLDEIVFMPSDALGAEFELDFFSLDKMNLPGIELKDSESPNGFAQFIPYEPMEDYYLFQIGSKLNLVKGRYIAHFKIKADAIDQEWKEKLKPPPSYRLYEYIDPKDVSPSDILYVSVETTRGTFFELPGYLLIHGEQFKEANKYYEFSIPFESDGKESLFLQGFSPRDRRYPANLYITYPKIESLE